MLERILLFSIHKRGFILLVTLGMALLGGYNFTRLPIDAGVLAGAAELEGRVDAREAKYGLGPESAAEAEAPS